MYFVATLVPPTITAYDQQTGRQRWAQQAPANTYTATAAVEVDGTVFVGFDHVLHAYDAASGARVQALDFGRDEFPQTPFVGATRGSLIVSTRRCVQSLNASALHAPAAWRYCAPNSMSSLSGFEWRPPTSDGATGATNARGYWQENGNTSVALDLGDGTVAWRTSVPRNAAVVSVPFGAIGHGTAERTQEAPAHVYVTSFEIDIYPTTARVSQLSAATGDRDWELTPAPGGGVRWFSSAAVYKGTAYFGTQGGQLCAASVASGTWGWCVEHALLCGPYESGCHVSQPAVVRVATEGDSVMTVLVATTPFDAGQTFAWRLE